MEYKIEEWEEMDLLVHAKEFHAETSETQIPMFWDEYYANEEYRKIPGYLGVCAQEKSKGDEFKYGIGCKATDVEGIPDGFEIIHIPKYEWAVFKCVGPSPKAIQDMWERIYKEWLPVSDYELIPDVDIENYLPGDPSSQDYVSEICIPVQKKTVNSVNGGKGRIFWSLENDGRTIYYTLLLSRDGSVEKHNESSRG